MAKTAKTFRLSEQAVERLKYLHETTGTNETAIIEIALALFQRDIERAVEVGGRGSLEGVNAVNSLLENAENVREPAKLEKQYPALKGMQPMIHSPKRKKHRRRSK